MNPETGTFISMDTYRGNAYDPASLHRYTYAQNNPQMYNDPSGHFAGLIGTCVSTACRSILSSWKGIALNALLSGAVNTIINQVLDTGESEIKSFVKGALVGGGFAAAYIGVCAIAAIFEVQAFVHLGFCVINSISAVSNLVIALAYRVTGNDKQALVHLSIGVLCVVGAMLEVGMSGQIKVSGTKGNVGVKVNDSSDIKISLEKALTELDASGLRPGQTELHMSQLNSALDGIQNNYNPSKAYSSVFSDGTNRYLVEGHHTTVAFKMLGKENALNMNTATSDMPSATNVYWIKKWYQFWRKAIKIVED